MLHYTSVNSKRVTRSVLAAELFAAVNAYDSASTLRVVIDAVFGRVVSLVLYIDPESLYDSLVGINATSEKRLLFENASPAVRAERANGDSMGSKE